MGSEMCIRDRYNAYFSSYYDKGVKLRGFHGYVPSYTLDSSRTTTIENVGMVKNLVGRPRILGAFTNETGGYIYIEISYLLLSDAIFDTSCMHLQAANQTDNRSTVY